jgi:hypothetical protein
MNWSGMNIPPALVFVGLWPGIPMWLVLGVTATGEAT